MARNNIGLTHYEQMLTYAKERERDGWYFGNKQQFEKRHQQIVTFLEEQIAKLQIKKRESGND